MTTGLAFVRVPLSGTLSLTILTGETSGPSTGSYSICDCLINMFVCGGEAFQESKLLGYAPVTLWLLAHTLYRVGSHSLIYRKPMGDARMEKSWVHKLTIVLNCVYHSYRQNPHKPPSSPLSQYQRHCAPTIYHRLR